jgi:hypothetical protein
MLNQAGIELPFEPLILGVQNFIKDFPQQAAPTVLKAWGIQLVSWVIQDYRKKSEGENVQGVKWAEIGDGAIYARLWGRESWRALGEELEALWSEEQELRKPLRKKGDRTTPDQRKRNSAEYARRRPKLQKIRDDRKKIAEERRERFAEEKAQAQVGVDTGRLVNSFVYGVSDLASLQGLAPRMKAGSPAPSKAIWELTGDSITVGSQQFYSGYFDNLRPIIPQGFLDPVRMERLQTIAVDVAQQLFNKSAGS